MLNDGHSDTEILACLDREFPPGTFSTTNAAALRGTKWDRRKAGGGKRHERVRKLAEAVRPLSRHPLARTDLVNRLARFNADLVIQRYRRDDLSGKTPHEILQFAFGPSVARAFQHERPSLRYLKWRWRKAPEGLLAKLNAVSSQADFDRLALSVGKSLVADWGPKNDHGEPSRMNIGIALKITNLVLKHLAFSDHARNLRLIEWLHVPWDRFTLTPLKDIWTGHPRIPNAPSQGFVKDIDLYWNLHALISGIVHDAGRPRIHYEMWAWDSAHQE